MQVLQGQAHAVDHLRDELHGHGALLVLQAEAGVAHDELQDRLHEKRLAVDHRRGAEHVEAAWGGRLEELDAGRVLALLLELDVLREHALRQELQDLGTVGREAVGLDGQPDRLGLLHAVGHVEAGLLALGGHGAGVRLPGVALQQRVDGRRAPLLALGGRRSLGLEDELVRRHARGAGARGEGHHGGRDVLELRVVAVHLLEVGLQVLAGHLRVVDRLV
mmetsp:Transcript_4191/g.12223  ORF Transcript_4191/g.12223 Transcript_4191/m.12223 type:complete len:220 (-) Transcript_4191:2182-2841(-)